MAIRSILQLGNPVLYEVCTPVRSDEVEDLQPVFDALRDTLLDVRERVGFGRGIAAPQVGVLKRIVYLNLHSEEHILINPVLYGKSLEMMDLWDDCLSFPDLLVRVQRHQSCKLIYRDPNWAVQRRTVWGGLSELIQHEVDHLEGVLAVSHAIDGQSFKLRPPMS
ncbi:MAG: peptide deformylase [Rhodothermales bacterium]